MQDSTAYFVLFVIVCLIPLGAVAVIAAAVWLIRRSSRSAPPATNQALAKPTPPMKTNNPTSAKKPAATSQAAHASPPSNPRPASAHPVAGSASRAVSAAQPVNFTAPPGGFTPIYLNFSNKPQAIVDNIDALVEQAKKTNFSRTRWSKGPRLLFGLGLVLILIEGLFFVLGYTPTCVFLIGGIALWIVAIFLSVGLRRAKVNAFPPRFAEFREMIHTLDDDLRPGSGFIGQLDLTGAKQSSKIAHEAKDAANRTTQYFRDQWLNMKAKMYDGNILRVSAVQRVKERQGYYKRSRISGKMKWKAAKPKGSYQELKVRIAVNPDVYNIVSNSKIGTNSRIGEYTLNAVDTEGGIVTVLASTPNENVSAQSVLGVLKFAYGLLQLKKA